MTRTGSVPGRGVSRPPVQRLRRAALLLGLALALATPPLHACECLWQGPFVDAARKADLVIAATVLEHRGNAMDVRVQSVLVGRELRDEVRIWTAWRDQCRPEGDRFPADSAWVLALQHIDEVPPGGFDPGTPSYSYGRPGDYAISACGVNWLPLRGGRVRGNLLEAPRWQYEGVEINPVLTELLADYLRGDLPRERLAEAARPRDEELRRLMDATRESIEAEP